MKSVMSHNFAQIPRVNIPRSVFDRSHGYKTTFDQGKLVPFYVDEALPGDTFHLRTSMLCRLATPIFPIMDNMFLDTFYFAVPNRLVWDNWEKFNGAQDNPDDSTDYEVPHLTCPAGGWKSGELGDYMGIPVYVDNLDCMSLPFRAYNLIFKEWFRDENLQNSPIVDTDDGPDDVAQYTAVLRRGKRHDYYTSALPWPQKGEGVELPLAGNAPVVGDGTALGLTDGTNYGAMFGDTTDNHMMLDEDSYEAAVGTVVGTPVELNDDEAIGVTEESGSSGMIADLSAVTAATINSLRQAFQIQKLLEKDARGGTRYVEIIKSHFGVTSPDFRLQRPEYLGGSSDRINIVPVQQTSETATTPQGNLSAYGLAASNKGGFTKSFTEHCIIIGLVNVRTDLTYQQGIFRFWNKLTRYDYYWPSFAHLGEQAILNEEIFADGTAADGDVFGYQERYAEYRYKPSQITGLFRSNAVGTLDSWHLSQLFGALPVLNSDFIGDEAPMARVKAVPSEPDFILDAYLNLKCARPMPVYSVPGLVDHF